MERDLNVLNVTSLRGGVNYTDPPVSLPADAAVSSINMDFSESTLGASRNGAITVSSPENGNTVKLYRHFPTNAIKDAQLFATFNNAGTAKAYLRSPILGWGSALTFKDAPTMSEGLLGEVQCQSLHGKLFLAYPSSQDRLHVIDAGSTTIRRAGLAAPAAAPTVGNTGSGTYAAVLRYYRVRYTVQSSGVTVLRSEPSASQSFTPSGSGTAARVTKPAAVSEGETHWEVEASVDNVNFYRLATVVVGTTTYDDSASVATYSSNPLSADIGDYTLPFSSKYLVADEDRLVMAGSWSNDAYKSRVTWTPVGASPGVGNDERLELDTDPFCDLNGYEGGEITALSRSTNGYLYAFKNGQVYRLVRTGNRAQAYVPLLISPSVGAFPNSVVPAFDEVGNPAEYFWDMQLGPQRIGASGVEDCGQDIRAIAAAVNADAAIPVVGLYYPNRKQVWFYIATGANNTPNHKLVFQIRDGRRQADSVRGGWTLHTGASCTALTATMYSRVSAQINATSNDMLPTIGLPSTGASIVALADTGGLDLGEDFLASVMSRPFSVAGLLRKMGATAATLVARQGADARVLMQAVRDYGTETESLPVSLESETQTRIIAPIDNFALSELRAVNIGLASQGDTAADVYTSGFHFDNSGLSKVALYSPGDPFDVSATFSATIGAWFRLPNTPPTASNQIIAFLGPGIAFGGFGVGINGNTGKIVGYGYGVAATLVGPSYSLNGWTHVALVLDWVVGAISLWVNGVLAASDASPIPLFTGSTFSVGGTYEGSPFVFGNTVFSGDIQAPFVVNRIVTPGELARVGSLGAPIAPNLIEGASDLASAKTDFRFFPLGGSTSNLSSFDRRHTLSLFADADPTKLSVVTAGVVLRRNPTPWAVDAVAVQLREEERQ